MNTNEQLPFPWYAVLLSVFLLSSSILTIFLRAWPPILVGIALITLTQLAYTGIAKTENLDKARTYFQLACGLSILAVLLLLIASLLDRAIWTMYSDKPTWMINRHYDNSYNASAHSLLMEKCRTKYILEKRIVTLESTVSIRCGLLIPDVYAVTINAASFFKVREGPI